MALTQETPELKRLGWFQGMGCIQPASFWTAVAGRSGHLEERAGEMAARNGHCLRSKAVFPNVWAFVFYLSDFS